MKYHSSLKLIILAIFITIHTSFATNVTIDRTDNNVILSWPIAGTNDFYLQIATNLSASTSWSNGADPQTNGVDLIITNQLGNGSAFYRLKAWEVLFDGTNTSAFRSSASASFPSNSWFVTNGMLASKTVANATNLMTVNTYTNFELRWNWKCATNGNSGVFYRNGTVPEYQLFDDVNVTNARYNFVFSNYTNQIDLMGSVFGYIAPTNKTLVPTGQWNDCRVVVQGYHVTHWLNGRIVVDYQINNPAYVSAFVQSTNTNISFQNKGNLDDGVVPGMVFFRDIKIRRLP